MSTTDTITHDDIIKCVATIIASSKTLGINPVRSVERVFSEEISRSLTSVMKARHCVGGGHLFPQTERETSGIDLIFIRGVSEPEMVQALHTVTPLLAKQGIEINQVHKPRHTIVDGRVAMQIEVYGKFAGSSIKTVLNVTGGKDRLPVNGPVYMRGPTFFGGQKPLDAYYESFEGFAARKLAAIALHPDTVSHRDFADIALLADMKLDQTAIGNELAHIMKSTSATNLDAIQALPDTPKALSLDSVKAKAQPWQLWVEKHGRGISPDFTSVLCDARALYFDARTAMLLNWTVDRKPRQRQYAITEHVKVMQAIRAEVIEEKRCDRGNGNVVQMGDYRSDPAPTYRPKF
jgi:hypothetical protein